MENPIETITIPETDTLEGKIYSDDDPTSPREWDNMGKIYYKHRNYTLGEFELVAGDIADYMRQIADDQGMDNAREELTYEQYVVSDENILRWIEKHLIILPLYIYEHGSITISTGSFSCPWDSGQFGYIVAKKGAEGMPDNKIEACLENEIKTYDEYLRGDVYGYVIEHNGEDIDSCWGFYGWDYIQEEVTALMTCAWARIKVENAEGKLIAQEAQA